MASYGHEDILSSKKDLFYFLLLNCFYYNKVYLTLVAQRFMAIPKPCCNAWMGSKMFW